VPEEIEIDTDKLREAIDEEIEKSESAGANMLRWVAHHHYAFAVALLQVAIALGAVAALTRQKAAFFLSMALGVVGAGLALVTAVR
jgi:hypothetical protein